MQRFSSAFEPKLAALGQHPQHCVIARPSLHTKRFRNGSSSLAGRLQGGRLQGVVCVARDAVQQVETNEAEWDVVVDRFPAPAAGSFRPDKRSFSEEHRVRGYEVSPDQRATIVTVANLLQEVAGNHAVGMWGRTDEGFASLPNMKDILFVMTRLQLRMYEYPKWGDIVTVETYFTEEGRLAFRRDWKLTNAADGRLLGAATSTWVNINTATRRLTKLPEDLRKRFLHFAPPSSVQVLAPEETRRKLPEMQLPCNVESPHQMARRSDMDMNGHINNVTYLAWALESVPEDIYNSAKLYEIEVDFKAECKAGDTIKAFCNDLGSTSLPHASSGNGNGIGVKAQQFLHMLQRCDEKGCTELVRGRTTWVRQH